jgi:holo-[acyl-carrier protein] synthase
MIVGLGIDVVALDRFRETVEKTPGLVERVFTPAERKLGHASLAARWAAKEALAKALGAPVGLSWQDAEVVREESGAPRLVVTGSVAERAAELGVTRFHLSMSHDGGMASAVVVAEADA